MGADTLRLAFDGGSRGNPGPAAWGVAVLDADGRFVEGRAGCLGRATNNVAEYHGLVEALRLATERGARRVHIQSDSELIVKQLRGVYRVRHPDLKPLYAKARALMSRLDGARVVHVPRAENKDADRMVNEALDRASRGQAGDVHEVATAGS